MTKSAEELQSMADECRTIAAMSKTSEIREQLLEVTGQLAGLSIYDVAADAGVRIRF